MEWNGTEWSMMDARFVPCSRHQWALLLCEWTRLRMVTVYGVHVPTGGFEAFGRLWHGKSAFFSFGMHIKKDGTSLAHVGDRAVQRAWVYGERREAGSQICHGLFFPRRTNSHARNKTPTPKWQRTSNSYPNHLQTVCASKCGTQVLRRRFSGQLPHPGRRIAHGTRPGRTEDAVEHWVTLYPYHEED